MSRRIFLIHPTLNAMGPIDAAFRRDWPEAQVVNLLDESLYADVTPDGTMAPDIPDRIASLIRHAAASGADGIVFTGSTFGPAVESVRSAAAVPVLKPDEAMAEEAVRRGRRIAVLATAKRALPVLKANLLAAATAAGLERTVDEIWVEGAQPALFAGRRDEHDRLIAARVRAIDDADAIVLGQISMTPARDLLPADVAARVLASPAATVAKMRRLLEARGAVV